MTKVWIVPDIALHTSDPGGPGRKQSRKEATYEGYLRQQYREQGVKFPICLSGEELITHVSVGLNNRILISGPVNVPRLVFNSIQPMFDAGALVFELPHTHG